MVRVRDEPAATHDGRQLVFAADAGPARWGLTEPRLGLKRRGGSATGLTPASVAK